MAIMPDKTFNFIDPACCVRETHALELIFFPCKTHRNKAGMGKF